VAAKAVFVAAILSEFWQRERRGPLAMDQVKVSDIDKAY
jgi:hypothetical protein